MKNANLADVAEEEEVAVLDVEKKGEEIKVDRADTSPLTSFRTVVSNLSDILLALYVRRFTM